MFAQKLKKENKFYGLDGMLTLYNQAQHSTSKAGLRMMLQKALSEVDGPETRKLLYILIFRLGDVPNRQHFLFNSKKQNGGLGARQQFRWALEWLKEIDSTIFKKPEFLRLIAQFNCWDVLIDRRVQGKKNNLTIVEPILTVEEAADFIHWSWESLTPYERSSVAKYTPYNKRKNKRKVNGELKLRKPQTLEVNRWRNNFLHLLAEKFDMSPSDMRDMLKAYRDRDVAVVATVDGGKRLKEMSAEEFFTWIKHVPNGARHRLKTMVAKDEEKWVNHNGRKIIDIFKEWELGIKQSQKELRSLKALAEQGDLTVAQAEKLATLKSTARVTVGAATLSSELDALMEGSISRDEFDIKADSIANRIDMKENMFFVVDKSGSMNGKPIQYANMILSLAIRKLKLQTYANFGSHATIISEGLPFKGRTSSYALQSRYIQALGPLYSPEDTFSDTYNKVSGYNVVQGSTNLASVSHAFREVKDQIGDSFLESHPIMVILTDNAFNNEDNPHSSLANYIGEMQSMGWNGLTIIAHVAKGRTKASVTMFKNIPNVVDMYLTNPGEIQTLLEGSFQDMVIDVYQPLLTTFNSNRYNAIRRI